MKGHIRPYRSPVQQQAMFDNTARAMTGVSRHIKERHVQNCTKADPAYGAGVAQALGLLDTQAAD
ncbi:MAG TPA: catalase-related domain-containing protein [Aliidongia sp.]|nr:catalase-related domain-containing protein [Aliidongia sp.]